MFGKKSLSNNFLINKYPDNIREISNPEIGTDLIVNKENEEHSEHIRLYPNPSQDVLQIEFKLSMTSNVHLVIRDISGKLIRQHYWNLDAGLHEKSVDVSLWNEGYYSVQILSQNGKLSDKFVVIH